MSHNNGNSEVILDVDHVWKIYCRNLKRAMWYGVKDLGREVIGMGRDRTQQDLRPGEFFAIKDASFQLNRGECVGLIGPNGAGKSTMLKIINGLVRPDAGEVKIRGNIGALIELGTGFNPILSGRENVYINASVLGMAKPEVDQLFDEIVEFAELAHVIDDPVKTYSSGMRVRLGFSVAANLRPNLLIMDEVLAVGDVGFRMKCFAHLRKLVDDGVSIILVTHAVSMLKRVANRAIVFGRGKITHDGDLDTGIAVYEEMMSVHQEKIDDRRNPKEQLARIESVTPVDVSGENQKEFNTDEQVNVQITIHCMEPIKNARIIAALASPIHGVISSVSSAQNDFPLNLHTGENVITLTYRNIPLLVGAYHFNVSLYGPELTDFYFRKSGSGNFLIVGPPIDALGMGISGIMKLDHGWRIDE